MEKQPKSELAANRTANKAVSVTCEFSGGSHSSVRRGSCLKIKHFSVCSLSGGSRAIEIIRVCANHHLYLPVYITIRLSGSFLRDTFLNFNLQER